MANRRADGRLALRTERAIELAAKREDFMMKRAQRAALEQQVRERQVLLWLFVVTALTSLALAVLGHPMLAAGSGAAQPRGHKTTTNQVVHIS